jgi:hypothetical protein
MAGASYRITFIREYLANTHAALPFDCGAPIFLFADMPVDVDHGASEKQPG